MPKELFEPARGQRVPVHLWARAASPDTVKQLVRIASRPYVVRHVAAMADAHVAHGVAVGTVFATADTVVPRALGGDLGCGISASSLSIDALPPDVLERLARAIPTGDAIHRGGIDVPEALLAGSLSTAALVRTRDALAKKHLATLGGGNHFVEVDRDPEGGLWLLVHSGSRGLGAAIAAHHARASDAPDALAGLVASSAAGQAYLADLEWALLFAKANRRAIADRALDVLEAKAEYHLDVPHNFVAREAWDGEDLLVHRKGAVSVPRGTRALVPGSMATASYVVEGLGSALAFDSCSHGAGRVLTRTEARAKIRPAALARDMKGIVGPSHLGGRLVEEAPGAYRDIREVLEDQADLVKRVVRLEPLLVLKG